MTGAPCVYKFMASMPQYAIWDDHDFGPNDAGKKLYLKDESRHLFELLNVTRVTVKR